jgi:hypothetical protein
MTLKKGPFDMIVSGEKKDEYRAIKEYWIKRLANEDRIKPQKYDLVHFRNGYAPTSPSVTLQFKGIRIGIGKKKWGAPAHPVFIIKLGKIVS